MKILIAEDDFTSRTMLQGFLAPYGEVHIAVSGEEAVQAFEAALGDGQPYDLLLLDILMPVMDGLTALKRIREVERLRNRSGRDEAKVIMTTAQKDPRTVMRAYYHGGACEYLVKPVGRQMLVNCLETLGFRPLDRQFP